MKTTPEHPVDTLPPLGSPIRPSAPKPLDVVRPFETVPHEIADTTSAIETIVETLRKKQAAEEPGKAEDWEGLCLDAYSRALLGCI